MSSLEDGFCDFVSYVRTRLRHGFPGKFRQNAITLTMLGTAPGHFQPTLGVPESHNGAVPSDPHGGFRGGNPARLFPPDQPGNGAHDSECFVQSIKPIRLRTPVAG
jgi:hypothetical protein